jgi:3-methyladenine DNA glycosylase AlkD
MKTKPVAASAFPVKSRQPRSASAEGKPEPSLGTIRQLLRASARPGDAAFLQRFFKTGPGQYGEGDRFLRVPATRHVARQSDGLNLEEVQALLHSEWHEERLLALLILVRRFERGDLALRQQIYDFYLRQTQFINNWDLVDLSAPNIVGVWLLDNPRAVLDPLARSSNLWERRIAVLATLAFIRRGEFADTLRLCEGLLDEGHDLMHKACGWMLREVGKRDLGALEGLLQRHATRMPRTMLRYAIEKFPEPQRKAWLAA